MSAEYRRRKSDASNGQTDADRVLQRLAELEVQMEHLMGNGQPGAIAEMTGTIRHLTEMVTKRFITEDAREAQRERDKQEREQTADVNWKKILRWLKLAAAIAVAITSIGGAITTVFGPTVRHYLHQHGWNIIESDSAPPKVTENVAPQNAGVH
jgi:hypothetical protein